MTSWRNPLPLNLNIPLPPHPGAFGVKRKYHTHEGVDLYCEEGTNVSAVESGIVIKVIDFTGPKAGSDWWLPTKAVLVQGESGVVLYGEIEPLVYTGQLIKAGDLIGTVKRVLINDKGKPTSMLHLELHRSGTKDCYEWIDVKPDSLLDPTELLEECSGMWWYQRKLLYVATTYPKTTAILLVTGAALMLKNAVLFWSLILL